MSDTRPQSEDRLLSLRTLATMTGMSVPFWRTRLAAGDLPSLRVGQRIRVRESDLQAWLLSRVRPPRSAR
jgi:excisionase family DNA binding protein